MRIEKHAAASSASNRSHLREQTSNVLCVGAFSTAFKNLVVLLRLRFEAAQQFTENSASQLWNPGPVGGLPRSMGLTTARLRSVSSPMDSSDESSSAVFTSWGAGITHRAASTPTSPTGVSGPQTPWVCSGAAGIEDPKTRELSRNGSGTAFILKVPRHSGRGSTGADSNCLCCCSSRPEPPETCNWPAEAPGEAPPRHSPRATPRPRRSPPNLARASSHQSTPGR